MGNALRAGGVFVLVAGIVILWNSIFIIDERQQALVTWFGDPVRTIREEGLKFKVPIAETAIIMERRVLDLDPPVLEVLLADARRLEVDVFARYVITDPGAFFRAVGGGSDFLVLENSARNRLEPTLRGTLRSVLGEYTLVDLLSDQRAQMMDAIREGFLATEAQYGIEIVDVRIRRADLPEQTQQNIYARMRSEREREAADLRAQGEELSQEVRSRAERERTVLLAEAERESQTIRGEGDREAIRIQAEAYSKDAEFFAFYRSLQAYRNTLADQNTTMVLSPDSEFFRFFNELSPELVIDGGGLPALSADIGSDLPTDEPVVEVPADNTVTTGTGDGDTGITPN